LIFTLFIMERELWISPFTSSPKIYPTNILLSSEVDISGQP
jgi:hypothetical protein